MSNAHDNYDSPVAEIVDGAAQTLFRCIPKKRFFWEKNKLKKVLEKLKICGIINKVVRSQNVHRMLTINT